MALTYIRCQTRRPSWHGGAYPGERGGVCCPCHLVRIGYTVFMYSTHRTSKQGVAPSKSVGLLERVREVSRYKHYSIRTESAYVEWIRRFVEAR